MYVEIYYFQRWWTDPRTTVNQKNLLRQLLVNGQWEFVMGGWVMPDEACTTYSANMDQLTEGHLFLNKTFGITPNIGWQIDPFGASTALATNYKMAGFKYHIIDRINYRVHDQLVQEQAMEFFWKPSSSRPTETIFTHILDMNYCFPMNAGFDFEGDPSTNPSVTNDNIQTRAYEYARQIRQRAPIWRTSHMLMLHQCDFKYQKADLQFDNMDKIISYIEANKQVFNMSLKWSKLSTYFSVLDSVPATVWPTRGAEDFFPYDDNDDSWWTGYFTSRPELKGLVRQAEAELRIVDNLSSFVAVHDKSTSGIPSAVDQLHQAMAIAQHHDAVAGTEKQAVAENYAALLWRARALTTPLITSYLNKIASSGGKTSDSPNFTNKTDYVKAMVAGSNVTVLVYNSLFKGRNEVIKVPVWHEDLVVYSDGAVLVESQVMSNLAQVESGAPFTLFVSAQKFPPAGFITLRLHRPLNPSPPKPIQTFESGVISNDFFSLRVNALGMLTMATISPDKNPLPIPFTQNFMAYDSYPGPGQASGAYIFRPTGPAKLISQDGPTVTMRSTPLVSEIHQEFSPYASQTLRLYAGSNGNYMDVSCRLGPLPGNKELVSVWSTAINTPKGFLFTDDNGFSILSRSWDDSDKLAIPANYYPSVYGAYLQPVNGAGSFNGPQFGVLTDRSHGVSSQETGSIEVMMHRRLLQDDKRGVEEPLNDTSIIYPQMRLTLASNPVQGTLARQHHIFELNYPLALYYSTANNYESRFLTNFAASRGLKHGAHVISSRMIHNNDRQILVRLLNIFAPADGSIASNIMVDLTNVFEGPICNINETSLTGMINIGKVSGNITITPKDVRTFVFTPC
jgi:hypothetical protein